MDSSCKKESDKTNVVIALGEAARVPALIEAGANIIGGCCGTTPEHIRAIKQMLNQAK